MTAAALILIAPSSLLLGAALQILVAKLCSPRAKGILAALFCLPSVLAVVGLIPWVRSGQAVELKLLPWDGPLALVFHVDALSVLFALMGTGLGAFVLLYSIGYMAHDKAATRFFCSMLVFIGGFVGLVFSANLFIFYLCWELVGLCSFSLVGFWYTNREAVSGARKVLLMTHIAGYGLLAAILVIYHRTGSALWTDPAVAHAFTGGVFVLMLVALVAKSVQVPPAHLDSRGHGRAHPGQRPAARRLLREGRRLSGRPHAQFWPVATAPGASASSGSAPSPWPSA